jgi:hypothetical protein
MDFFAYLEQTGLSRWVREDSSLWAYPGVLLVHTVGVVTAVGISVMIDLRLLGFAGKLPVPPLERYFPIIWTGFWISGISGAILLAADATTKVTNPVFGIKMILTALAVVNLVLIRRVVFRDPNANNVIRRPGKLLAAVSLVLWFGAMTAGRLTAYLGAVSGVPGLINRIGG